MWALFFMIGYLAFDLRAGLIGLTGGLAISFLGSVLPTPKRKLKFRR